MSTLTGSSMLGERRNSSHGDNNAFPSHSSLSDHHRITASPPTAPGSVNTESEQSSSSDITTEYILRILQVKKIPFTSYDLASDPSAKRLWKRKAPLGVSQEL